jgi:hypothetical protein
VHELEDNNDILRVRSKNERQEQCTKTLKTAVGAVATSQ